MQIVSCRLEDGEICVFFGVFMSVFTFIHVIFIALMKTLIFCQTISMSCYV